MSCCSGRAARSQAEAAAEFAARRDRWAAEEEARRAEEGRAWWIANGAAVVENAGMVPAPNEEEA